jgi:hypothetical protein
MRWLQLMHRIYAAFIIYCINCVVPQQLAVVCSNPSQTLLHTLGLQWRILSEFNSDFPNRPYLGPNSDPDLALSKFCTNFFHEEIFPQNCLENNLLLWIEINIPVYWMHCMYTQYLSSIHKRFWYINFCSLLYGIGYRSHQMARIVWWWGRKSRDTVPLRFRDAFGHSVHSNKFYFNSFLAVV